LRFNNASRLGAAFQIDPGGVLGELAQDTGKVGRLLAIWNVSAARDLAARRRVKTAARILSVLLKVLAVSSATMPEPG